MISDDIALPLAGAGGVVLGMIFFGGLWWTVQKRISSDRAALWFIGSRIVRTGIATAGFYLVSQKDWRCVLVCLFGFLAARITTTCLVRRKDNPCA
jgi:F1F0 ATPase subunit 2